MGEVTIDSYDVPDLYDPIQDVHPSDSTGNSALGQCFTVPALYAGYKLTKAKFSLRKVGSPVGNVVAALYNMTGTLGSTGKPTGAALATSDPVAMAGLTTSFQLITFTFSTPYVLAAGNYCIEVQASDATTLDTSNYVRSQCDATAPGDDGNGNYYRNGSWTATASDQTFYVLGERSSAGEGVSKLTCGMGII